MEKSNPLLQLLYGILVPIPLNGVLSYIYVILNLLLQYFAPNFGSTTT